MSDCKRCDDLTRKLADSRYALAQCFSKYMSDVDVDEIRKFDETVADAIEAALEDRL